MGVVRADEDQGSAILEGLNWQAKEVGILLLEAVHRVRVGGGLK